MITRSGATMIVAAAVLLVAGILLDYPELVVLGLGAATVVAAAAGWMLARPEVTIEREIRPDRVAEGGMARGVLVVTNTARRRSPPMVVGESVGGQPVGITVASLPPGGCQQAEYQLPTAQRGVFEVGPLTLGHADPLRLMHLRRGFPSRSVLRVYPKLLPVVPLPTGGSPDLDGPTTAAAAPGGVAFHGLRDYVRGDDLRLIHWRSTARAGKFMVRHNVVPREPRMLVVLDTSAAPYLDAPNGGRANDGRRGDGDGHSAGDGRGQGQVHGRFEDAVRIAASLAAAAVTHGFPVEVHTTGGQRAVAQRGEGAPMAVLDLLAGVEAGADDPGLTALTGMVPRDGGVVLGIVTGQPAAVAAATVSAVRPRFAMVTLVQVGATPGRPGPAVRGALVLNVRTSEDFVAAWNTRVAR
ncbi:hypothetical protein CcI49_30695 [Frankia sp. CcI49]|uniref:DUF58 domain-containing protein n=1 Tax=Frankia sp. CcI49 TaxID=1745382 RepID=UPI000977B351|nr:DUF58 domain-containing protein [Frankia sp. CcI49]ONH54715.1 hypothetical protein CcI49_30695 [Frankia sp. CcI49]